MRHYQEFKRHRCGHTESGDYTFWTRFHTVCPACGKVIVVEDVETFIGYVRYDGIWFKPWTWGNLYVEKTEQQMTLSKKD